jgi:hypothetical protein
MTRTVRTTMQPHLDVEVDDAGYLDLHRQGLLLPDSANSAPEDSGEPVASHADMHVDVAPIETPTGAADVAELEPTADQAEPDHEENPA